MEQQSQQQHHQHQKQHQTTAAAAATTTADPQTRQSDEEAFDSLRQAALVMFKQRTKDLTRLASVEAQSQAIEAELQQAQTHVTQLSLQQAALDAAIDDEQQRIRQRSSSLADVNSALVQLDEEQRLYKKLQHSAEAAVGAAADFIAHFTDADGRLFQLLTVAKARVDGRSARELQAVVAQVQAAATEVAGQHEKLRHTLILPHLQGSTGDGSETTPSVEGEGRRETGQPDPLASMADALTTLQGTAAASWTRHGELAAALLALRKVLALLPKVRHASDAPRDIAEAFRSTATVEWPALPECPGSCADERWLLWPGATTTATVTEHEEQDEEAVRPCIDGTGAAEASHTVNEGVAHAVEDAIQERMIAPLKVFQQAAEVLRRVCAETNGVAFPPELESTLAALDDTVAEWESLLQSRRECVALQQAALTASAEAQTQVQACDAMRVTIAELSAHCANESAALSTLQAELRDGKEAELHNYAAAWQKGGAALCAQQASLRELQQVVSSRQREAAEASAAISEEAERHAQTMQQQRLLCLEQQAKLAEARRELEAVQMKVSAAEAEAAEARLTNAVAQGRLDELLLAAQAPHAPEAIHTSGVPGPFACLDVSLLPPQLQEWATATSEHGSLRADADTLTAVCDALSLVAEAATDAESADQTRTLDAALSAIAAVVPLPAELLRPMAIDKALLMDVSGLLAVMKEVREARTLRESSRAAVAEMKGEAALLLRELEGDE